MDNELWLKPRWADTRPSSVLACEHQASLARRSKRLPALPSSIECSTQAAPTLSAGSTLLRNPSGSWENSAETRSMQQRPLHVIEAALLAAMRQPTAPHHFDELLLPSESVNDTYRWLAGDCEQLYRWHIAVRLSESTECRSLIKETSIFGPESPVSRKTVVN